MKKKKILKPMTKKERIEAVILGEHVDRIPYSLCRTCPASISILWPMQNIPMISTRLTTWTS